MRAKGAAPSAIHRTFLKVGSMTVAPGRGLGNCVMANARIEFTRQYWMLWMLAVCLENPTSSCCARGSLAEVLSDADGQCVLWDSDQNVFQ